MKTITHIFAILSLLLFSVVSIFANTDEEIMKKANQAYTQENYNQAITLYKKIVDNGNEGSVLFYNLGNAFYKNGDNAQALLWYERALRMDPNNEDIIHNIAFVNQKITDKIEAVPQPLISRIWNQLSLILSERQWAILSITVSFVLFISLAFFFISNHRGIGLKSVILFFISLFLIIFSLIFAIKAKNRDKEHPEAIVMELVVNTKSEPSPSGKVLFVVHEGLKVEITSEMSDWVEIKIPNGEKGWVTKTEIIK